ncbi:hypothetical protein R70006_06277 [Paraburkholderia domus]|uniref:secretion/conjugation apparatus DotM-related subunit n=1 Tax=Paraburkholderia domus TaxID=2793075 RepID=UPI001B12C542|nr:hypothetical protein [Paraburkholderia domus]CAE6822622.1 hypothetical protein R70006_06277 [Paraburkholderia domus]
MDPMMYAILGVLGLIVIYAFWYSAHASIARFYSWIRIAQFGVFVLGRTGWGALTGLGLVGAAFGLRMKKEYAPYAKWAAILGAYLVLQYGVSLVTHSAWGCVAGLVVVGGAFGAGQMGVPRKYTGAAMVVGLMLTVGGGLGGLFASWFGFFLGSDPEFIEWKHIQFSTLIANGFTLVAFNIPLCFFIMRRSLATNPTNHKHFGKTQDYTLHTFTDEQAQHYPHLKLFRKIDLTSRSIHTGKYRMADTEKDFAIKHKLLDRVGKGDEFKVNRDRAAEVFRKQLGRLWRTPKDLTKWEAAVLAVLLPRIAALDPKMSEEDYKEALATTDRLLAQYWRDAGDSYDVKTDRIQMNMTDAVATLRKYWNHRTVRPYFKQHAYVYTLIYAMLNDARRLGVLPANEFRWLRVADRRMWIMVDNVGRIVAFTEVAGIYSHFLYESKQKRAVERFAIDGSVKGLIEGVDSYKFTEDEIAQINGQLAEAEAKDTVDPNAVSVIRQTLLLGCLRVRSPELTDMIDVALLSEKGEVLYRQQCKPQVAIELIRAQHPAVDDARLAEIVSAPPSPVVAKQVLEKVNGHDLVMYYGDEVKLFPGIERSAVSVRVLEEQGESVGLQGAAIMEGVVDEPPKIGSADAAANLVRMLWLKVREAEMRAQASQQERNGNAPS